MKNYILIVVMLLIGAGEAWGQVNYLANGNSGFGGAIGNGTLSLSDNGTTVFGTLTKGGGNFSDAMVIYLDTRSGGFSSTANFTDYGDGLRRTISVSESGSSRTIVTFPSGFGADYAIALGPSNSSFGGLWELVENGSHTFVASVNLSPTNNATNVSYTFDFDFSEVSTQTGIKFVAKYTSLTAHVSDEVIGTSSVSGNPGNNGSITFSDSRLYQSRASITNAAGWRLLSSPVSTTYGDILSEVWTQGSTGADVTNGVANVRFYTAAGGFSVVANLSSTAPAGQGFLYQHFNDDNYDATPNASATTLSVTGAENASGTTYTPTWTAGTEYGIAGNPFATTIDWDLVGKGAGVSATAWVYDRNISNYVNWNGTTGSLTDGLIAPFQGFWIEYTSVASTVTFESADKSTGGTFYRKDLKPFVLAFEGASGEFKSAAYLEFEEGGTFGKGSKDALAFISLSPEHLTMSTISDGKAYSINHLPMLLDRLELPLDLQFTEGGIAELSVKELNLPTGWMATLYDNSTDREYELSTDFRAEIQLAALKSAQRNPLDINGQPVMQTAATAPRFTLVIDPSKTTSVDGGPEAVGRMSLEQNYPNPFNPTTQIRFTLQSSDVTRLTVYDVLGREVSVLVNGAMSAGSHSVTFDASNLPSGVYMVKLEAGAQSMTRRMTLLK